MTARPESLSDPSVNESQSVVSTQLSKNGYALEDSLSSGAILLSGFSDGINHQ